LDVDLGVDLQSANAFLPGLTQFKKMVMGGVASGVFN
jgi:hypothetical protein